MVTNDDRKEFIKQLRQNSNKYREKVLKRTAGCEVCGWGTINVINCLQVHHICPVSFYADMFLFIKDNPDHRFLKGMPDEQFEIANQIVLCPNCHAMVHAINKQLADTGKDYQIVEKYVMLSFYKYANEGIQNIGKYLKLKEIATGQILRHRLFTKKWKGI